MTLTVRSDGGEGEVEAARLHRGIASEGDARLVTVQHDGVGNHVAAQSAAARSPAAPLIRLDFQAVVDAVVVGFDVEVGEFEPNVLNEGKCTCFSLCYALCN